MKTILIQSPYLKAFGPYDKVAPISFPMGLGYIAAYLIEHGFPVQIMDPENERIGFDIIRDRIQKEAPDIVGITCVTPTFSNALRIAKIVKEVSSATVILGGVHAAALPETILKGYPEFDIILIGEGEDTMLELCQHWNNKERDIGNIKGIAFRQNGSIIKTPPREWIKDIDKLPFPARHLVNMDRYRIQPHMDVGKKTATMVTSRGCPFHCIFCSAHISMGRGYRPHSPEYVIRELEHLKSRYGIEHIYFHDDTMTVNQARMKAICNLMIEKKLNMTWICLGRVDNVTEELAVLMKKAGCYGIGFGVESGDERILRNIKKGINLEQCRRAFRACKKAKIKTYATFLFGNPEETKQSIEKTINFAIELDPMYAMFYVLTPFPGSEVFNIYNENLFSASTNYDDYNILASDTPLALKSYEVSPEDLKHYISVANRRFYFRPKYILRQILNQRSWRQWKASFDGMTGVLRQIVKTKAKHP